MAERRKAEDPGSEEEPSYATAKGISFMERWRRMEEEKKKKKITGKKSKYFMRCVFTFQIPTQVYVFLVYIIPHFLQGCDPMTVYYFKVIAFYVGLMMTINLFCVTLYNPAYTRTKDQPLLPVANNNGESNEYFVPKIQDVTSNGVGDHTVYDMTADFTEGPSWHFCEKCAMHVPFRTHHCDVCKKCIVKRDHHCFIVATCIGYNNQRYFLVLTFYVIIAGVFGTYYTSKYIGQAAWEDVSWYDFIVPVPLFHWMFGGLRGLICMMIVQIYIEIVLGLVSIGFFFTQLNIILRGQTLYESKKSLPVRNTNPVSKNLQSVFGDFWFLNFLFPMTLIFPQRGDGTTWEGIYVDGRKNGSKQS